MLAGVGFGTAGVGSGAGTIVSDSSGSPILTGILISALVKAGVAETLAALTGILEIQWGTIFYIYSGNSGIYCPKSMLY